MLTADVIFNSLFNGKTFLKTLQQRIIDKRSHGEKVECEETKFIVLTRWIGILQDYFDSISTEGDLPDHNLSINTVYELMAKIDEIIDVKERLSNAWLLQRQLNDEAVFDDSLIFSVNVEFS